MYVKVLDIFTVALKGAAASGMCLASQSHAVGSDHRAAGWTSHKSPSMPWPYLQAIKLYVMSGHWSFQKCPH